MIVRNPVQEREPQDSATKALLAAERERNNSLMEKIQQLELERKQQNINAQNMKVQAEQAAQEQAAKFESLLNKAMDRVGNLESAMAERNAQNSQEKKPQSSSVEETQPKQPEPQKTKPVEKEGTANKKHAEMSGSESDDDDGEEDDEEVITTPSGKSVP